MITHEDRVELSVGESVEVQGDSGRWTVKRTRSSYFCSCPAWKYQRLPVQRRTCKHLKRILGAEHEERRVAALVDVVHEGSWTIKTGTWTISHEGRRRTFRVTKVRGAGSKFAPGERLVELLDGSPDDWRAWRGFGFANADSIAVYRSKRGDENRSSFEYFAAMLSGLMGGRQDPRIERDWAAAGYELRPGAR